MGEEVVRMAKAFLIDTTLCTACRGCQVACKQWHDLPVEETVNRGSFQNPEDLSFNTYKLVRMREEVIDGRLRWLFFPDQCRHCLDPPCAAVADDPEAIYQDGLTGAVVYTANTGGLFADEIRESCPYDIPRKAAEDDTLAKCDMCVDRVHNGLPPACVKTCPTGAMQFGERGEILANAQLRLSIVQRTCPEAQLLNPDEVTVIYLVAFDPLKYHRTAIASRQGHGMTRHMALRRMTGPVRRMVRAL